MGSEIQIRSITIRPGGVVTDIRENPPSLAEIRRSALALIAELRDKPATPAGGEAQKQFLIGRLRAIASRVDLLLGAHLTFDQETQAMFGVQVPPRYDQSAWRITIADRRATAGREGWPNDTHLSTSD